MRKELTDRLAKTLAAGIYWDAHRDAPRGFLLQVTPAGARAYRLNYRRQVDGRERRKTIGDVSAWPVADARKEAAKLRRYIDTGGDPLGDEEQRRAEPAVTELVARFIAEALPSRAPRTQDEYRVMLERYLLPAIGKHKVAAVERRDIEKLHSRITATGKKRRANAVLTIAHVLFEQAIAWKMRGEHTNPAARIKRNAEHHRERYLTGEELDRLIATLDRWQAKEPDSVDMIRLLLLTGARRGEAVGMLWSDVDLDAGIWTKQPETTKQRKLHRVPLSVEAVELLRRRSAAREQDRIVPLRKDDRVFRGRGAIAFRLERHWVQIRAAAGLEDVRLHDLRHSFASFLVGQGLSLPIIGAMLGHAAPATTSRYAHLADAPLREAAAIVGKIIGVGAAKK